MVSSITLRTDRQLQAYLHRMRMRILSEMRVGPATVSMLAQRVGVHPANLSRHMRILEDAGLIERVGEPGGVEKFYRPTADYFEVEPDDGARKSGPAIALSMLKSDIAAAESRLADMEEPVIVALLGRARISQSVAAEFAAELHALVTRFREVSLRDGGAYHLNVSLYPGGVWEGPSGPIEITSRD